MRSPKTKPKALAISPSNSSIGDSDSELAKKSRSSSLMAFHRVTLRFHMMPRYLQIVLATGSFLIGYFLIFSTLPISPLTEQEPDKLPEKFRHRPHFTDKPRILSLQQTSEEDRVLSNVMDASSLALPEEGHRQLVDRYNPLPRQNKLLKGPDSMDKGDCQPMYDWQRGHDPTCNIIHEATYGWDHLLGDNQAETLNELDSNDIAWDSIEQTRLVAAGAFRQVFKIFDWDGKTKRALKTLRVDSKRKDFDLRSFDRHRRDAISFEQLTSSPLIVDMYAFCTNSAVFDWGDQGTLEDIYQRDPDISKDDLLEIAYNVSLSVAHAHNFDDQGRATLAHTDIKPDQFLVQDGYYKLTDFNRVRFLLWNKRRNIPCGFTVGKNGGIWRSPEEYAYEEESEKVDVYSLGNVLYFMLTREYPWNDYPSKEVYEKVKKGKRPKISDEILASTHPFDEYMIKAIEMCYTQDQFKRPGAAEVAAKLQEGIDKLKQG
ncbi:unnamed protein product [Cylindrotheca closterium]|uniref:Protein kinase domain-containing protein n=1 Tax=Cylindrotheca closterium TaxID=2856 RepID=A0AAD2CQL2_9STRA|nr:unnamed protein product [Cylindrotheca closterium]